MTRFNNPLQEIKHRMYSLRNGAVADAMRRMGAPYKIIFGLNLPQLTALAAEIPPSPQIADELWHNDSTRESRLLAPMVYPPEQFDISVAREWVETIATTEVADILCLKLLKKMPWACTLAEELILSDREMYRYTALRLMFNLLPERLAETRAYAVSELERKNPLTAGIASALVEEIDFITGSND